MTVDPRLERISSINEATETAYLGAINGTGGIHDLGDPDDPDDNVGATADLGEDDFYSSQTAPLIMVSYAELKFIEAEALFLQNGGNSYINRKLPQLHMQLIWKALPQIWINLALLLQTGMLICRILR